MTSIIRPEFRCGDCDGTSAPLCLAPRNDGHGVQLVLACEHLIREWYPETR